MMTFEQYRLLSEGMTQLEVEALAGKPDDVLPAGAWLYDRDDGYLVGLTWADGRLARVDESKRAGAG
jgi:flavin-dependent dehydrogenase